MAMKLYSDVDIQNIANSIRSNGGTLLPKEYTQVEYIENNNSNFINTNINAFDINSNIKFVFTYSLSSSSVNEQALIGSKNSTGQGTTIFYSNGATSSLNSWSGTGTTWTCIGNLLLNTKYTASVKFNKISGREVIFGDFKNTTTMTNNALITNNNFAIFSDRSDISNSKFLGKIFNLNIYKDDILTNIFIPCYRNSDNEIGMYDLVNNVFYTNAGTGTFLKGAEVQPTFKVREMDTAIDNLADKLKSYIPHTAVSGNPVSVNNAVALKPKVLEVDGDSFQSKLPKGYTQVDYIESTGTQYIDTGIKPNQDTSFEVRFQYFEDYTYYNSLFGSRVSSKYDELQVTTLQNYRVPFIRYDGQETIPNFNIDYNWNIVSSNKNIFYLNGVEVERFDYINWNNNFNIYLFLLNQQNAPLYEQSFSKRISNAKFWDNETLIRNFIPCYRNSDNEIGMYDLVNNVFYTNQGTDSFTYGSIATPSPDNEVPINTVKSSNGTLNLGKMGKNKFDKTINHKEIWHCTKQLYNNGFKIVSTVNSGVCYVEYDIPFKHGTYNSITFSFSKQGNGFVNLYLRNANGDNIKNVVNQEQSFTISNIDSSQIAKCEFYLYGSTANIGDETIFDNIQLEISSSQTPYEPYKHDTIPFNIGTTEFASLPNGVKDKFWVNLRTGKYGKTGYVGENIYDGSSDEEWYFQSSNAPFRLLVTNMVNNGDGSANNYFISDYYQSVSWIASWANYDYLVSCWAKQLVFRNIDIDTLEDWKAWLSTHNVKVKYELATPVTTTLGTLSQENLAKLVMYAGVNNIDISGYDDNGAEPIIELDYYTEV